MRVNPLARTVRTLVILAGAFVMAFPLFYLVSASLMTARDISAFPPYLLPPEINWDNFAVALDYLSVRTIVNSFIFSFGVVGLQLALGLPTGLALAKMRFRGRQVMLVLLVAPLFIPNVVALIPQYVVTWALGWVNTYAGLIVPVAAQTAFATLLFRQFFLNLPDGLIEAARIDGANWFQVLVRVVAPLSKPAVATYASVTFLTAWHMYVWPLVIAPSPRLRVLPVALAPLAQGEHSIIPMNVSMAAALIATIPVLFAFLAAQKWYVKSIAGTGLR